MSASLRFSALALTLSLVTSSQAALVGYWELNGNATATVGTNGVLVNGPVAGLDRNGNAGGALSFNGALQQFVSIPGGGGLNAATDGTISMWVQWNGTQDAACCGGTAGNVLARQSNGIFSNNIIGLNNTNPAAANVTFQGYGAGGPILNAGGPVGSTYHHIAVSFKSGEQKLYVDGNLVQTAAVADVLDNNPAVALAIGAWNGDGGGFSTSNIDDVAIYNTVLKEGDIRALAEQNTTPKFLPLGNVTVIASSEIRAPFTRAAGNIVDGIELTTTDPDGLPGVLGDGGMWLSAGTGFGTINDAAPSLTFNLGAVELLGSMAIYNYNEPANAATLRRGVDEFRVLVSNDNFVSDTRNLGIFELDLATGTALNPGQLFNLGVVGAQFVRFEIISNHNGTNFVSGLNNVDFNFVGLNEVQFFNVVIPEPATASLALLGLGGLMLRRRRMA